jgi:hypothetical protein
MTMPTTTKTQPTPAENAFNVAVGQLWQDTEPGNAGTLVAVDAIYRTKKTGIWKARVVHVLGKMTGRKASIALSRFHGGNASGYTNVTESVRKWLGESV